MDGWIKIYRKISDNPLWTCEPFTRGQAWVDLILLASFNNTFFYVRGIKIEQKRGQVCWSEPKLADRWKWSRTKLRKFLNDLEKEQQIIQQKNNVTQVITIINYDEYQEKEQQTGQQKNSRKTAKEQQKDVIEEVQEIQECKEYKNSYKKTVLSQINLIDFPELNGEYIDIAKAFNALFCNSLKEAGAATTNVEKAKGTWIDDVRMMIETDGYTVSDLRLAYQFLQKDAFWKQNILSTSKLREKMPQIKMKMHNGTNRSNNKEATSWCDLAQVVTDAFNEGQ